MEQVEHWRGLLEAADRGALSLDPTVAEDCVGTCSKYIGELTNLQDVAVFLSTMGGMGTLPSGLQLQGKFQRKALGGDNSLYEILQQHIDVVTAMRAVFQKIVTDYQASDAANAMGIDAAAPR